MTTAADLAAYPLPRERNLILSTLLVLAAGAWALLLWQSTAMDGEMSLTMSLGAPLFIALWIVMMVAIMFPTAAPMMLMFNRIHKQRREKGQSFVPTIIATTSERRSIGPKISAQRRHLGDRPETVRTS